ncbi:MAG: AI-2E family transporter [Nocardioides sp.]|nr:AI-2E family transporter [Nocardioides sp.]
MTDLPVAPSGPPQQPAATVDRNPTREALIGSGVAWLSRWSLRWIIIAAGLVLVGLVVRQLWSILLPIVFALVLSTVLQPPARWLEKRFGAPPAVAAGAAVVGVLALVALVVIFIAPTVGSQVGDIADSASEGLTTLQDAVQDSSLAVTQNQLDSVVSAAQDRLSSSSSSIAAGVVVGVGAVTNALINVLLTLVLSFFFVKDGRRFLPWLSRLSGPRVGVHLTQVGTRAWSTLGGFVRTQALVGLIDAVLIGTGLLVVGVPLALPLAVLTFVAAFAPIIGAVTIGLLAVLVALVANGWVSALIVLVIVLVVQQLEGNVFLPWLQGRSLQLHAGVVLLTIVLGSTLYGVAGAFLGVPAVAVLAVVLRYLDEVATARLVAATPRPSGPEPEPQDTRATNGR